MIYQAALNVLRYDYTSDKLSIPLRIRERHLSLGVNSVELQGVGPYLQIIAWSERDNILVQVPLKEWIQTRDYEVSLRNGIISVGKFEEGLEEEDGQITVTVETINQFKHEQLLRER